MADKTQTLAALDAARDDFLAVKLDVIQKILEASPETIEAVATEGQRRQAEAAAKLDAFLNGVIDQHNLPVAK